MANNSIRRDILKRVAAFSRQEHKAETFIPGQTLTPFARRVFDEKELVSLVDSALDFWLTAGPYADKFETAFARFMVGKALKHDPPTPGHAVNTHKNRHQQHFYANNS